jgi:exonuclease III
MAQPETKLPLNILSLNVRGLNIEQKRDKLFFWLNKVHNTKDKIIFLQETHMTKNREWRWNKLWPGTKIFSNGTSRSRGVAILLPKSLDYEILESILDPNGRYIALKIVVQDTTYGLINGYAPTADRLPEQMIWQQEIMKILENLGDAKIIMGGDLNDGLTPLDKFQNRETWTPSEYVEGWRQACAEYQLVDIWRILNPREHKYTWKQGTKKNNLRRSRLDFWIISTGLMYSVNKVSIEPGYGSDHSLIKLSLFKQEVTKQGPSFWKWNTSLLRDKIYTTKTTETINNLKEKYNYVRDKGLKWDLIKMELRRDALSYSKFLAKNKRDNFQTLITKQKDLEDSIANNPTDQILEQADTIKEEIEAYNKEKAMGAKMRSKADWIEHGEKSSKYFLTLENKNRQVKNITMLITDENRIIKEQDEILQEELRYYKLLYTQPTSPSPRHREQSKQYFMSEEIPKISEQDKTECDMEITYKEISNALKELKNGKTPGSDGFPPDFYKFFWKDLGILVFESLQYAEQKKEMSIDQKRGVINLIPKQDKDIRHLKNWRPISLLNTDYKILTKSLATRLKKVLPSVIHPDQVAYLKGRYIGQNIRTIIDIMDYTKEKKLEGIIAFLDFEKAFDSINWQVIDEALMSFNIGKKFRNWVKIVYKSITSCVTNCGFSSEHFDITRGVRQGCPLSAYLFIAVVEILAIKIRNNKNIQGIKVGDQEVKVIQMADDTTNFLKNEESLKETLETLNKFHTYSGLKLNLSKCEAMWLGAKAGCKEKPLGLKWVTESKALGIHFSYDANIMFEKNFTKKLKELKRILAMWGLRDLSVLGRITVFKSLALSKVIYQCNNLYVADDFIKELNQLAFDFIWNGKPDKVKRTTIIAGYERGGLRMLDVPSFIQAQKVMWVKRLLKLDEGSFKAYPNYTLNKILGEKSFNCRTNLKVLENKISPFYYQLLKAWEKTKDPPGGDPFSIRRETLWKNKYIMNHKKEIYYENWFKKGIITIHDILLENGEFKQLEELSMEFGFEVPFMEFNALKLAIPLPWKRSLKSMRIPKQTISNEESLFITCNKKTLALSVAVNKDIYWDLIKEKQTDPIVVHKWCTMFNMDKNDWPCIFEVFAGIKEAKLKAFQFKVLYNLLPCNLYLSKIGRSNSDKCPKCYKLEDMMHYLVECPDTTAIWSQLSRWWQGLTNQDINLKKRDILIGVQDRLFEIKMKEQLNEIITLTKWKIHANKQLGETTCFYQILYSIKYMISLDEVIATRTEKLQKHEEKWKLIKEHLT